MKFIKKFDTLQDYNKYLFSEIYINPNVSKINNNDNTLVKFDEDAAYLDVKINVSTIESPTLLSSNSGNSIEKIILEDGTILNTPDSSPYSLSYQFDTIGIHNIKVKFRKINDEYKIYPDLSGNSNITKISIPGIYTISNGAFGGLTNLNELNLPGNLKNLPVSLFGGCFNLKSLTIPNTVERIDNGAFTGCGIEEINIPDSVTYIGPSIFSGNQGLKKITFGRGITDNNQLEWCGMSGAGNDIENITILGNVDTIPNSFASGKFNLKSVILPSTIKYIDNLAFSGCIQLTTINIPDTIEYVADNAFGGCNSLLIEDYLRYADNVLIDNTDRSKSSYTIKNGTKLMCSSIFAGCTNLENITIPNTLKNISEYAFNGCSKLTEINIPNSVNTIGIRAFQGCTGLISINIPNNVTQIGSNAFNGCGGLPVNDNIIYADTYVVDVTDTTLTTYNIKEGTRFIGTDAFANCTYLTEIDIPNTVISIGSSAFYGCANLSSLTIPSSIKSIGVMAFFRCTSLTSITIKAIIPPILDMPGSTTAQFDNTNNCPIYVPAESVNAYKSAQHWTQYADRIQAIPSQE